MNLSEIYRAIYEQLIKHITANHQVQILYEQNNLDPPYPWLGYRHVVNQDIVKFFVQLRVYTTKKSFKSAVLALLFNINNEGKILAQINIVGYGYDECEISLSNEAYCSQFLDWLLETTDSPKWETEEQEDLRPRRS